MAPGGKRPAWRPAVAGRVQQIAAERRPVRGATFTHRLRYTRIKINGKSNDVTLGQRHAWIAERTP
jgi:hypothetical protein